MRPITIALAGLLAFSLAALWGEARAANKLTVFAAASLKTALDEVVAGWEGATGHSAVVAYAGSSTLARQIEQGAPADVFLSANEAWMDTLERQGLIVDGSRDPLLGNTLVLIAPSGAGQTPLDELPARLGDARLAMAFVNAVPAGIYGKAALEHLALWQALRPRVAEVDNVRRALALVAAGEAAFGIVYATDAAAEPRVTVAATIPAESHPPIVYPAAAVAAGDGALADAFLAHLRGGAARAAFARHGFGLRD